MPSNTELTSGWQSDSNIRGTADILWSCFSTIFLCLWSMLHLNLPAPTDGYWTIFCRKARWLLLGILAPEVPMLIACGQWSSAKRSVRDMKNLGFTKEQWSLSHGFFADSGGMLLKWDEDETFPITAKQVVWLVRNKHIDLPNIPLKDLRDKSKADVCTKFLAALQTAWLLIQIFARMVTKLPVTPIELASAALALTSLTTLWFWLEKPLDAQTPYLIPLKSQPAEVMNTVIAVTKAESTITHTEVLEARPIQTLKVYPTLPTTPLPLDNIEPNIYISRRWSRHLTIMICQMGLQSRKLKRIPNDRDPQLLGLAQHITLGIATASFASIHFADWSFPFPTRIEQYIWRANCIVMWSLLAVYGSAEVIICCREGYSKLGMDTGGGYKLRFPACLWFFVPGGVYFLARLVLIAAVFVGMRALPVGAFQEVQWTTFLPHI